MCESEYATPPLLESLTTAKVAVFVSSYPKGMGGLVHCSYIFSQKSTSTFSYQKKEGVCLLG